MFPKKGNNIPDGGRRAHKLDYAAAIAAGLKCELGGSHRAVKTVMRWTHTNERTVKNWLTAKRGPRGEHLIALIRNSDEVLDVVLRLACRDQLLAVKMLIDSRNRLAEMLAAIDDYLRNDSSRPQ